MSDELAGAGITAKERLERIEAVLERIDTKLDTKVDQNEFQQLKSQVVWLWRIVILAMGGFGTLVWLLQQHRII